MASASSSKVSKSGFDLTPFTANQIAEAKLQLDSSEKYIVSLRVCAGSLAGLRQRFASTPSRLQLLESGTERAFSGKYYKNKDDGVYVSALTGVPMFDSTTKFVSSASSPPNCTL
jgi:hypothetical protein